MSTPDKQPRKDQDVEAAEAQAEDKAAGDNTEAPKKGLKYVFKISPADPKNNLDFEDVADK